MTRLQGVAVIALLFLITAWTYGTMLLSIGPAVRHDEQNMVKIECFLHADNAKVHQFCVDHGYDR